MTTTAVGPANGTLTLHTGVEGRAARMGHALTIAVGDWEATAFLDGDVLSSFELRARLGSLLVLTGEGGLKPLSDKDRAAIRDNALETLRADSHPDVVFTSTSVSSTDGGYDVAGDLSVSGRSRPASTRLQVRESDGRLRVTGEVAVVQTEHGITPYSSMMGGLKVRDRVDVRVDVSLPQPG